MEAKDVVSKRKKEIGDGERRVVIEIEEEGVKC